MKKEDYLLLESNFNEDTQFDNIVKLARKKEYANKDFIMPNKKKYWENAARVLEVRGYPQINDVIPQLFEWLQDINWPGSDIVQNILKKLPREVLIHNLEESIKKAISNNDDIWLNWLHIFIKDKMVKEEDFNDKELFKLLDSHYDFFA